MHLYLIMTTVDKRKIANKLAKNIVRKHLAACVSISSPIYSHYVWNQNLEKTKEYCLLIKTSHRKIAQLKKYILRKHPYKTPEILIQKIDDVNSSYGQWVQQQTL